MAAGQALSVETGNQPREGDRRFAELRWRPVLALPCQLSADLPLPEFKVRDFLKLKPGSVISSRWLVTLDVPVQVNGVVIGWGEFEGSNGRLAVRVTELA